MSTVQTIQASSHHIWSCHVHPSSRCKIYLEFANTNNCFHVVPLSSDRKLSKSALQFRVKPMSNEYWEAIDKDSCVCLYYSSLKKDKDFVFNVVFAFLNELDRRGLIYGRFDEKSKTHILLELVKYHLLVHRNGRAISFCNKYLLRENKVNRAMNNIYSSSKTRKNILKALFGIKCKPNGRNTSDIPNWVIEYVGNS